MVAAGRDPQPDKREQVRRLHRAMKETPVEANRTLIALSAVFGYADRAELVPAHFNSCRHVERFAEKGERRALSLEELRTPGRALAKAEEAGSAHPSALLAIRLLARTGFRRAELLGHTMKDRRGDREGLRWGDVDLNAGLGRLRDSKTGAQTRVIGEAAIRLFEAVRPETVEALDPVGPGTRPGCPFIGIDKVRVRIYRAAGLAELPGVDLHSLRHTFASVGAHVYNRRYAAFVSALLGHGSTRKAITERYIHANRKPCDRQPTQSPQPSPRPWASAEPDDCWPSEPERARDALRDRSGASASKTFRTLQVLRFGRLKDPEPGS